MERSRGSIGMEKDGAVGWRDRDVTYSVCYGTKGTKYRQPQCFYLVACLVCLYSVSTNTKETLEKGSARTD